MLRACKHELKKIQTVTSWSCNLGSDYYIKLHPDCLESTMLFISDWGHVCGVTYHYTCIFFQRNLYLYFSLLVIFSGLLLQPIIAALKITPIFTPRS